MKKKCLDDKVNMTSKFLSGEIGLILDRVIAPEGKDSVREDGRYFVFNDGERVHSRYYPGEGVAVAMSYRDAIMDREVWGHTAGWTDKSQVNANYMPYRFVVERVRCVRVQDLTEEDVLKAGVRRNAGGNYYVGGVVGGFDSDWRVMFSRLFDRRSKVPYALNPWVIVYDVTPVLARGL